MNNPFDVLREPPFAAVTRHMEIVTGTVERLVPLFQALNDGQQERVTQLCAEITALEEAADQIKNAVRDHLPATIKLPISRRDLLTVVSAQDTISDNALRIVWMLEVRRFTIPVAIRDSLFRLLELIVAAVRTVQDLSKEVEILSETRFQGPHLERANALMKDVESREADCDRQARDLERALFAAEAELDPVSVILWYNLIELLGSLADNSKKQANRVRMLLAR